MDLQVISPALALWKGREFRCAIGRSGFVSAEAKQEGDGATPIGRWAMRRVFFRPDREEPPQTVLPLKALQENDAWCDAPQDPGYNRYVRHPYGASIERLWRDDHLYDIVVVLGYNDAPVIPGKGSAIFLHIAHPHYAPSAGCVTLAREDLLTVLREAANGSAVLISPQP